MRNKNDRVRVSFSTVNEKLLFSKEAGHIGSMTNGNTFSGKLSRYVGKISRSLSYTSTRTYGAFMLTFGFLSLVLHITKYFVYPDFEVQLTSLIVGMLFTAISIPLLLSDKPMCIALQDNPMTDYILFEFFAIKRMHRINNERTVPPAIAVFLGFIPAGLAFLFPTEDIAFVILSVVIVILSFVSPEFPLLLTVVSIPYLTVLPNYNNLLFFMSVVSFLSYVIKVAVGKRVYRFEIYDIFVIAFIAVIILSGSLGDEAAFNSSLLYGAMTLLYFTSSNLLINRRLADLAINAIIVSSVPVSIYYVITFFLNMEKSAHLMEESVFVDTTTVVAYFTVSIIFALGFVIQKKAKWKKLAYFVIFVLQLFSIGLTVHPGIPFVIFGIFISYVIINMRRIPVDVIVLIIGALYSVMAMFPSFTNRILSNIGFSASIVQGTFDDAIFTENPALGGAFKVGFSGGAYNLFALLMRSVGIVGFAIFVLLMLVRIRHMSYYRVYVRNSLLTVDCNMSFIALMSLLILGAQTGFLSLSPIYALFIVLFGIGNATLRAAKKGYDDRLGYYADQRSSESSAIDILLQ